MIIKNTLRITGPIAAAIFAAAACASPSGQGPAHQATGNPDADLSAFASPPPTPEGEASPTPAYSCVLAATDNDAVGIALYLKLPDDSTSGECLSDAQSMSGSGVSAGVVSAVPDGYAEYCTTTNINGVRLEIYTDPSDSIAAAVAADLCKN